METPSQYVIQNTTDVALLDCKEAFDSLSSTEKLYAHYLAQASFKGGLIVLFQTSPESPGVFVLLQKLFRNQTPQEIVQLAQSLGFSNEEQEAFLIYAAAFYCNMGNYKSFGDTKFVPGIEQAKLEALIKASLAYQTEPVVVQGLWDGVKDRMFSLDNKQRELGLGDKGTTTYYSANCDENDAKVAQDFLDSQCTCGLSEQSVENVLQEWPLYDQLRGKYWPNGSTLHSMLYGVKVVLQKTGEFIKEASLTKISPYNTRLFKTVDKAGLVVYEVRLASTATDVSEVPGYPNGKVLGEYSFTPKDGQHELKFKVTRGDYSSLMALLVEELRAAQKYVSNDVEKQMLEEYIKSFSTGSLPAHKDGSRHWIKNKGPIVETYIGFIESYRDPYGVRGEFEGFVAVVNKAMSAKFTELVNSAEHLLAHLPWPSEYEKDTFLRPDFTSLDVLAFGGSGIPAGINIPNYDDIRQSEGFKNVSLGNVLTSGYKDTKITFLRDEDKELYTKYKIPSFEVQVGLHELLGHGSGKLFIEESPGKFNFDIETVTHTETKGKITSWYKTGETWDSKFSTIASTYEECRAECVGIYLCLLSDVLKIFGHTGDDADDIIYVNWLNMVRAGLLALEFYSPETGSWRQAHMNGRFVILRVMLEAGEDLVRVEKVTGEDGKADLRVILDRAKIISVGKPAIGAFLRKLQVYKSTGDVESARKMYQYYSDVNDQDSPKFLSLRSIVMDRKQPRKLFVQHHTQVDGEMVKLLSYDSTASGLIQSFVDRFPSSNIDDVILKLWAKEKPFY